MSGSFALRKLLFNSSRGGAEADESQTGGYHTSACFDALSATGLQASSSAACQPRSGRGFASACLAASFLGCALMKNRNREKWWLGLLFITGMYYNSMKAHKAHNGLVGHQCGFFAAGLGAVGCTARVIGRLGSQRHNLAALAAFLALMWYEVGRYHVWSDYVVEFKKEVSPERSMDLLAEYVPPNLEIAFLPYRPIS